MQTQLFSVPVWLMHESFFQDEFSVKMGPSIQNQRNPMIQNVSERKQNEKCTNQEIRLD